MCGFCGFRGPPSADGEAVVRAMNETLVHRGPDGDGVWTDVQAGVALAHRRLAIVDLSPLGAQPMVSGDGRWVIAYNGEIYNFQELRALLEAEGVAFRGASDSEALVEAIAAWGLEAAVRRLNGIFAFAAWDRGERILHLVRDPLGVKPLYWGRFGRALLFGSQPKALARHPAFSPAIDRAALAAYFRLAYTPAPSTIYQGVHKLEAGTILSFQGEGEPRRTVYWNLLEVAQAGLAAPLDLSDDAAADALEALLTDAVGRQMVADVPLGAFLSGGIDSSTVVALMRGQSARPVRSFTIGFDDGGYDEAADARAVAAHLGTEHTELRVEPAHALAVIPRLPEIYDEPFADSSQIPTFLVSEMTRRSVTVALSGDGGDELFAGYNRHQVVPGLWRRLGGLPVGVRRALAAAVRQIGPGAWDALFRLAPAARRPRQIGDKLSKLAAVLASADPDQLYRGLVSQWPDGQTLAGVAEAPVWSDGRDLATLVPGLVERMQLLDTATYLPDDVLAKVDRASMGVGLEARVPLLDQRVVEFAWRLPLHQRVRGGVGKFLLRRVLHRHVPAALVERPKMGFAVPIDAWLRGPLRDWAEDLLDPIALAADGLIAPAPVTRAWSEHKAGTANRQAQLWTVLMFQAWRRHWRL